MPTKLLSLYLRAGTGAARLAFRLTERVVMLAGSAIGITGRDGAQGREAEFPVGPPGAAPEPQRAAVEPEPHRAAVEPEPRQAPAGPDPRQAQAVAPAPRPVSEATIDYEAEPATPLDAAQELAKTVDDEPELVEELAEPGAEDGAGAAIEVDEPWEGYAAMNADAVIARLREATAAELALVELYEQSHKQRQTVLAAAERRHRDISGPAAS